MERGPVPPPLMSGAETPFFTVVVPVRNGGEAFARSLAAIQRSLFDDIELVVVDDGSTDGSDARARSAGATVLSTEGGRGPAAARNLGARNARGRTLFFLDADCELHREALERTAAVLRAEPDLDVVFGSYDDDPSAGGVVSRYRNLLHHHVHQRGRPDASTFWAGCGAIRRSAFEAVGGFDAARYPHASVEDIDLGVRLLARGGRIRLAADVLVTHHKAWTLGSMLWTDMFRRAAPWTRLAFRSGGFPRDLNTGVRERASLATLVVAAGSATAAVREPALLALTLLAGLMFGILNLNLVRFLRRRGGIGFALRCMPLHTLHILAGGLGLVVGTVQALGDRLGFERRRGLVSSSGRAAGDREARNPTGPRA